MAQQKIRKLYFDTSKPGSLSSKKTFLRYNPRLNKQVVNQFFAEEASTKVWFPSKVSLKNETPTVRANYFGQYIMADTGFFKIVHEGAEREFKVMGICDVWSRYFVPVIIERASGAEAVRALKKVITEDIKPHMTLKLRPITVLTDKGSEFLNSQVSNWLQSEPNIMHATLSSSASKASIIERKWRTLKSKIEMYIGGMKFGESLDFEKTLLSIAKTLNGTKIRTIGDVSPDDLRNFKLSAVNQMRRKTKKTLLCERRRTEVILR